MVVDVCGKWDMLKKTETCEKVLEGGGVVVGVVIYVYIKVTKKNAIILLC